MRKRDNQALVDFSRNSIYRLPAGSRLISIIISSYISKKVATRTHNILGVLDKITDGDLDAIEDVRSNAGYGITGMTNLLMIESLSERQSQYVKDIKMSAKLLLGIINDIWDLSKIRRQGCKSYLWISNLVRC